jgi:hypothetical protein
LEGAIRPLTARDGRGARMRLPPPTRASREQTANGGGRRREIYTACQLIYSLIIIYATTKYGGPTLVGREPLTV